MAEEQLTVEAPVQEPVAPVPADPFALEESSLASLSPEQRASLDPILNTWRERAKQEIEKSGKSVEDRYAPLKEKAEALDKLVQHQPFVQWWQQQQRVASQGQTPQVQEAIQGTKPVDIATPEEWSQAVIDASNGNPQKLQTLNSRMMQMWAAPVIQNFTQKQRELDTRLEMKDLMESHPDYKDLDQIGLDDKGEGVSLLEHALNWAESNNKPLEEGYQLAQRWFNAMKSGANAQAMGLVKGKQQSVTAGPSTATGSGTVVYVDSQDELIKKSMEAALDGRKDVRFEVRPKK